MKKVPKLHAEDMIRVLKLASILVILLAIYCLGIFLSWTVLVPAVSNVAMRVYVETCLFAGYVMWLYIIVIICQVVWEDISKR